MTVRDPDGREWTLQAPAGMSQTTTTPDSTAIRTALWRALHVEVDAPPHVLDDRIGLQLADAGPDWRQRPDMDAYATPALRASIVARARYIEDLVAEQAVTASRSTFSSARDWTRSPSAGRKSPRTITIFEVDQPGPRMEATRLVELGFGVPDSLRLVPVDFETSRGGRGCWPTALTPRSRRRLVPRASMYLTREATAATLRQSAVLAPGSTCAMTFLQPLELVAPDEQDLHRATNAAARASGTPFISYYAPAEILAMAREAGFASARHVSAADYAQLYFADRTDGLLPFTTEELLVATT